MVCNFEYWVNNVQTKKIKRKQSRAENCRTSFENNMVYLMIKQAQKLNLLIEFVKINTNTKSKSKSKTPLQMVSNLSRVLSFVYVLFFDTQNSTGLI